MNMFLEGCTKIRVKRRNTIKVSNLNIFKMYRRHVQTANELEVDSLAAAVSRRLIS
jgi:hypothetical protein